MNKKLENMCGSDDSIAIKILASKFLAEIMTKHCWVSFLLGHPVHIHLSLSYEIVQVHDLFRNCVSNIRTSRCHYCYA